MFLPHVFMVEDVSEDTQFVVSLTLSDWSSINTDWMCNSKLPDGKTYRSSIDITIVEVETSRHQTNAWLANFANLANELSENGITRVADAVSYIKEHHHHLIKYMN